MIIKRMSAKLSFVLNAWFSKTPEIKKINSFGDVFVGTEPTNIA